LRNYGPNSQGIMEDLCPDNFEVDSYGAIFESSFIALLPFIQTQIIQEIYNKID